LHPPVLRKILGDSFEMAPDLVIGSPQHADWK
jgi:hypothetical protein